MLRSSFLWLSERRGLFDFIRRNGFARQFASRFVAGETLDDAVAVTRELNRKDITTTLDLLGESVRRRDEAERARDEAVAILERINQTGVRGNLSIKLSQLGLDLDPVLAAAGVRRILDRGRRHGIFVRIDMEASSYVQPTLDLFFDDLEPAYGELVGVVIQTMLRRSPGDVEQLIARRARVRLVKGAYQEPASIAFPDKRDVDATFRRLSERLLDDGNYPAFATHDERLIAHVRHYAARRSIGNERFEFQMLYGVRRDLQEGLRQAGYNVRVYVPFGTEWYPYLMRRLAERPANVWFMVGSVWREAVSGARRS